MHYPPPCLSLARTERVTRNNGNSRNIKNFQRSSCWRENGVRERRPQVLLCRRWPDPDRLRSYAIPRKKRGYLNWGDGLSIDPVKLRGLATDGTQGMAVRNPLAMGMKTGLRRQFCDSLAYLVGSIVLAIFYLPSPTRRFLPCLTSPKTGIVCQALPFPPPSTQHAVTIPSVKESWLRRPGRRQTRISP
jgi:hypothetical protein